MNAARTARERVRSELRKEILAAARRHLGDVGPSALSLRAVARDLEMASSAIYRYFPSRDELLTVLIVEGYKDIGAAAENADDPGAEPGERWMRIWRAVREWALANRHEFALLFGTPVPGYSAPLETTGAAGRMPLCLARVAADAKTADALAPPEGPHCPPGALDASTFTMLEGAEFDADEVARLILAWNRLVGILSYELHGHLVNVAGDYEAFFEYTARTEGSYVGLDLT